MRLGGCRKTVDGPKDYEARLTVKTVVHPRFVTGFARGLNATTADFMTFDVALLLLNKPSAMPVVRLPQLTGEAGLLLTAVQEESGRC